MDNSTHAKRYMMVSCMRACMDREDPLFGFFLYVVLDRLLAKP